METHSNETDTNYLLDYFRQTTDKLETIHLHFNQTFQNNRELKVRNNSGSS